MGSEGGKIFEDTPTSNLYPWSFGINSKVFVYNNRSKEFTLNAINLMKALLYLQNQRPQVWYRNMI